jgi:DNA-binding SARP family transcriptional activator/ABC-type transport system substrate-binding protein
VAGGRLNFRILGPLELRVDGEQVRLGGPKQRALLALLLLSANRVVSRDRLLHELAGGGEQPEDRLLRVQISRLRKLLGPDSGQRLVAQPPGYLLRVEPGELDLDVFERALAEARERTATGEPERAAAILRDGLDLWRGRPLADLEFEPFVRIEIDRLQELRLAALEELNDAELAVGRHAALVPELESLLAEHPLRERLSRQLMLALYRSGRQADALETYRRTRAQLDEELGLEPGVELRRLEQAILVQDEKLELPTPAPDAPRVAAQPARPTRALRIGVAGACLLVAAATATGIVVGTRGSSGHGSFGDRSKSRLIALGSSSEDVASVGELEAAPASAAFGFGSLWVAEPTDGIVARADPRTGAVIDRISVAGEPASLAVGGGAVWAGSALGGTISRIDPSTGRMTQTIDLGFRSGTALAFGHGRIWATDAQRNAVVEIRPATGERERTVLLDFSPSAIAVANGGVWVAGYGADVVEEIEPGSGETVASVNVGRGPSGLALTPGAVWVTNSLVGTVSRIDPRREAIVATISVGSGPSAIVSAGSSVWVASSDSGTVVRIDASRNRAGAPLDVGGEPTALATGLGKTWVGARARGRTHRGGTLRLVGLAPSNGVDPARQLTTPLLTRLSYDDLLAYRPSAGAAGLHLVPDLASALPTVTDRGKTYVFRLRANVRYSDGRLLEARDFRRGLERVFRIQSGGEGFYGDLKGAAACFRNPSRCDLSAGIMTDDLRRLVIFHLVAPDPDFPDKLTILGYGVPIPPGTPDDSTDRPVPGTGPYRIVRADSREVRWLRNPWFRARSPAKPEGNADVIVWRFVSSNAAAVREVEQGRADWTFSRPTPEQLRELAVRSRGQVHSNPTFAVEFLPLNTHARPFDDVRVRRALNYAIDRGRLVRMYGGGDVVSPACQPLAPGLPGFRRYCPYTTHPQANGNWSGPDLARARRLVAASGTRGSLVDVWGATDVGPRGLTAYVAQVLRILGYRTRLHVVPDSDMPRDRTEIQMATDGDWLADYPAPSSYLPLFFGCRGSIDGYVCDPAVEHKVRVASSLQVIDVRRSAAAWADLDHYLVDQAYWVPTVNVDLVELTSKRLENYEFSAVVGFLAEQAWLR